MIPATLQDVAGGRIQLAVSARRSFSHPETFRRVGLWLLRNLRLTGPSKSAAALILSAVRLLVYRTARGSERVKDSTGAGNHTTLVSASTGNHGQSIAYAGRRFNIPVIIFCRGGENNRRSPIVNSTDEATESGLVLNV